jgi:prepilin-type N-terminal cleavage/methylation domain-containing protein
MRQKQKTAFSLIELSIVVLIVSILISGAIFASKSNINNAKTKVTKEKLEVIYKAMVNFVYTNKRLPCPADLTTPKSDALYGNEASTNGICDSLFTSVNALNLVYGTIPYLALGINKDMVEDGFGTKFSYAVDARFTKASVDTSSIDGFEITQSREAPNGTAYEIIKIQEAGASDFISTNALFAIISHGANKYGGHNADGTLQNNVDNALSEEIENSPDDGTNFFTYDNVFISYSQNPNFDDIVLFKSKIQLARDAGLKYIMCSGAEADDVAGIDSPAWVWTGINGEYNMAISSFNSCSDGPSPTFINNNPDFDNPNKAAKMCGQYGIWSSIAHQDCVDPAI